MPQFNTTAVHGGDHANRNHEDIAPAMSTSTTFRVAEGSHYNDADPFAPTDGNYCYSRYMQPTRLQLEKLLEALIGRPTITVASGMATSPLILNHVRPGAIAITKGYMTMHASAKLYAGADVPIIDLDDEYPKDKNILVWVETPLNPLGTCRDLKHYTEKAHAAGGKIAVDSTLAPPPLQDPFKYGVDYVVHSGTKYFGGHSDCLMGTVSVQTPEEWRQLYELRLTLGGVPGSLETWLVLRSLKTLGLRVRQQSQSATRLAHWFAALPQKYAPLVQQVFYPTLQQPPADGIPWVSPEGQLSGGGPACFSILMDSEAHASKLMFALEHFAPATSLGGVESLVEHRCRSSPAEDRALVRLSVGIEDYEDLQADFEQAFDKILQ